MTATLSYFIDQRLDSMLANPEYWGNAEAFELQVILLLEIKAVMSVPRTSQKSLRWILDEYYGFLCARRPDSPPRPLSAVVGEDFDLIARHLQSFRDQLSAASSLSQIRAALESIPSAPAVLGFDVAVGVEHSQMPRAA